MTVPVLRGAVTPARTADAATPLLVLGPSLGTALGTWDATLSGLPDRFRVLRWDLPGHGGSPATAEPFTVAELADAVVALVDSVGGGPFAVAGVSLGGAVAVELAAGSHAARVTSLGVLCSSARIGEPQAWHDRAAQVRAQGTASLVAATTGRWFAPDFPARDPDLVGRMLAILVEVDDASYARCCEALAAWDRRADAPSIAAPTLVLTGDADRVVTTEEGDALAAAIPTTTRVVLDGVGHQPQAEAPDRLAAALAGLLGTGEGRYEAGLAVRRAVLGAGYVDAALAAATPETADFQRYITETAWGSVWTRPGLDRRLRSAVTIASLVTGHHWQELELHLHAGLRNGLTRDELVEILLQTAVYAGVPAANTAFGVAKRVFEEE